MKNFIFGLLCLLTSVSTEANYKVMFPHLCQRGQHIEKALPPLPRDHIRQSADTAKNILEHERKIVFPSDGRQPNQRDAALWSRANEKNNVITDWYISAFCLSNDHTMHWEFDTNNTPCPIISFHPDFPGDRDFQTAFCKNFRKIAPTSVGRVLLYRLLLEIRRVDQYCNGVLDPQFGKGVVDQSRNILRQMYIRMHTSNGFDFDRGIIYLYDSKDSFKTSVVNSYEIITMEPRTDDVSLFHETLHWLHGLCDIKTPHEKCQPENILNSISEGQFADFKLIKLWCDPNDTSKLMCVPEEFCTIMGYDVSLHLYPQKPKFDFYCFGLSENLYRLCIGQKLRYGHNDIDGKTYYIPCTGILTDHYENIFKKGGYQKIWCKKQHKRKQ